MSSEALALCLPCIPCPFWPCCGDSLPPGDVLYKLPGDPLIAGDTELCSMGCHAGLTGAPLGSAPPKNGRAGVRSSSDNESRRSSCSVLISTSNAPSIYGRPEIFNPPGERGDLAPAEPDPEEPVLRGTFSACEFTSTDLLNTIGGGGAARDDEPVVPRRFR